jgi:hypothetical protein
MNAQKKIKPNRTSQEAIAIGFWEAFGTWSPNTPAIMAKAALMALDREGYKVIIRGT